MKLDRDINTNGLGKYAIINLRNLQQHCNSTTRPERWTPEVEQALKTLSEARALQWGCTDEEDEFFLIKLKDRHSTPALQAYADSVGKNDPEYAQAVLDLARRSGSSNPFCKEPD